MRDVTFRLFVALIAAALSLTAQVASQTARTYPAARQGGNYMHNYYFPPAPSSTPWAPAWSPDGQLIAVAMSGSIWTIDPASGSARELTYSRKYHSMPDWSLDGRWIAYVADEGGGTIQLEIVNVATGQSHPLTSDDRVYMDPAFSPDGSRLAYVSTKPAGNFNVFIRSIKDGQFAGDEIAVTRDNDFGRDRLYFGRMDMHITPAWLPGGEELLLVSNRNVPLGSGNVLRVPAAANGIDKATTVLTEQTLYRTRPHVSIDGKRFVYSSTRGAADQFNNLYVQPTSGGEPYKLTFFQHDAFHPRFSPDGEWIAFISNEDGLPQLQLLETYGGALRKIAVSDRRWRRPMGVLSVRTIDATTHQPTAARIHLTASDGKLYAPVDAYARVSGAGDPLFHQTGTFRVDVPAGDVTVEAVKGFEYAPAKTTVRAVADGNVSVDLELRPIDNLSARGWYNGSTHVHMNYAGNLHNTLENLMMMSAAEDQDMVNEQIANKDNRILDHQHFVPGGKAHPLSTRDRVLVVGQEYRPPFYGHVFMFLLRDHLISPFTTGYEGTAIESLYPSNTDMFRKAKAQGATVGYVHAFGSQSADRSGGNDPLNSDLGGAKGFIVDAALRTTDAIEWSNSGTAGFYPWYAVLNNGLHVTAVGGEDSISSMHRSKLVGSARTYVYTGDRGLDAGAWFEGLRQGRAFVTTGPLVDLAVNGRTPGEHVMLPAAGGDVTIAAQVRSITPLETVTLIFNGEVVETLPLSADRTSVQFSKTLRVTRSGWYHLRAEGNPKERYPLDTTFAQAFTNPVWVTVGDRPVRSAAAAEYCLKWIEKLQQLAEKWPGWRSQKEKDHVYAQFDEARKIYRRLLQEATAPSSPVLLLARAAAPQDRCGALSRWSPPERSTVTLSRIVPADRENDAPSYCEVQVTISPVEGSRIGAVYRLPERWNGKILGIGGGGAAGNLTIPTAAPALSRGYAVIQNDLGHATTSASDWSFAVKSPGQPNTEAIIDFGHRATHLATVVGKAAVTRFYGRAPERTYFEGCSTGGRQGLAEVQRYPDDYDGVIAGAPVHSAQYFSTVVMRVQAFHKQPGSNLLPAHATLIQNAVLAACDAKDGVADGVITDPRACDWDPGKLQCRGAASPKCLTRAQVQTVRRIYSGSRTRKGQFALIPLLRGSESDWELRMIGTSQLPRGLNAVLGAPFAAYVVKHDPSYDVMTFDPERDLPEMQRSVAKHVFQEETDISAFLNRGGKLLLWHGFNDPGPSPLTTIQYFEDVQRRVPASNDGVRLFLAPGVLHCRGGAGADRFDMLTTLEHWVEKGVPPASIVATRADGRLSRPLCPYPQLPKYTGRGNTNDATNFECKVASRRR